MEVSWKENDVVANRTLVVNSSQVITAIRNTLIRSYASRQAMITGMSPLSNRLFSSLQNCHQHLAFTFHVMALTYLQGLGYDSFQRYNSHTLTSTLNFTGKSHVIIMKVLHLETCILIGSYHIWTYLLHENDTFTCSMINLSKSAFIFVR